MSRFPLLLVLGLAGGSLVLTGMVSRGPGSGAQTAQPPAFDPGRGSAEAAALLDRAVETYGPARVQWTELQMWQQTLDDDLVLEVRGRYLAAPGYRVRVDYETCVGATRGEFRMISDGKLLWHWQRLANDPPILALYELPKVLPPGKPPEWLGWARDEALRDWAFWGVGPLLGVIRARLQAIQSQTTRWNGVEVVRVTGAWPEDPAKMAEIPEYIHPRHVPRLCSIYLDARTLWPHRVEWWGSERAGQALALMVQTEFRNPTLNQPLPPERCAREFTIPR